MLCGPSTTIAEFVEKKGHEAKTIRSSSLVAAAARFGIKTDAQVLSENEKKGKEIARHGRRPGGRGYGLVWL